MKTITDDSITIDMTSCSQDAGLIARKIWQELFRFYRAGGGDIEYMDSMLCDLRIIEARVREGQVEFRPVSFLWEFKGRWTDINDWGSVEFGAYQVVYDPENVKFTIFKPRNTR